MGGKSSKTSDDHYLERDNIIQTQIIIDEEPNKDAILTQLNNLIKIS